MKTAIILLAIATAMLWGYLVGTLTPQVYGEPYLDPTDQCYTKYSNLTNKGE